jgi:hypothetical protein
MSRNEGHDWYVFTVVMMVVAVVVAVVVLAGV